MTGIVLHQRRSTLFFWCGCALVTAGVLAHLPMFLMGRSTGYVLAGMPMGFGMLLGMAAIVAGVGAAAYGLLPTAPRASAVALDVTAPLENARLGAPHWRVAALLALALVIDIMKPASLGFVTPRLTIEYHNRAPPVSPPPPPAPPPPPP